MIADILLPFGIFSYRYSTHDEELRIGTRVEVEVKGKSFIGFVINKKEGREKNLKPIKRVIDYSPVILPLQARFSTAISDHYLLPLYQVMEEFIPTKLKKRGLREVLPLKENQTNQSFSIWLCLSPHEESRWKSFMEEIRKTLKNDGTVLILFPQYLPYLPLFDRLAFEFKEYFCVYSSEIPVSQQYKIWKAVYKGEKKIIAGTWKALFLPFSHLQLIIVESMHSPVYKTKRYPYFWAPFLAELLSKEGKANLILSSPVPPLEYLYRWKQKEIKLYETPQENSPPKVVVVNMRREKKINKQAGISSYLKERIEEKISQGEKVAILSIRKGYAGYRICKRCRYVQRCKQCGIPLAYHKPNKMICHQCGREEEPEEICPRCQGAYTREKSPGTQKIMERLKILFPQTVILRLDKDSPLTSEVNSFSIVVGTIYLERIIRKFNFSLFGLTNADTYLYRSHYLSHERTFQLIGEWIPHFYGEEKEVVIQTYHPENAFIKYAVSLDIEGFYSEEIKIRKELGYPPFSRVVNILIKGNHPVKVERSALVIKEYLKNKGLEVLGPALLKREKNRFSTFILLKSPFQEKLRKILKDFLSNQSHLVEKNVMCLVDFHPQIC